MAKTEQKPRGGLPVAPDRTRPDTDPPRIRIALTPRVKPLDRTLTGVAEASLSAARNHWEA